MTKFTHKGIDDVAQAVVDLAALIADVEFVASDRRTSYLTVHDILKLAAAERENSRPVESLSAQLMNFISSYGNRKRAKLSIVRAQ